MDPLDTNQFTQQLVQFAQVEQQLKQNDQLASLIAIQKTTQATQALNFVGSKVVVDGTTSALDNSLANWSLTSPKDVSATVNIMNKTGQTVYTGTFNINAGKNEFVWDGKGNDGVQWPDGDYKIQVVAKDSGGQPVVVEFGLARRGRLRRPDRQPAAAVDRHPDLHGRPGQAHRQRQQRLS